MTTQRKLTRPGLRDNEYMAVTCTPDKTGVEFFEFIGEAEDAARANLHPSTTSYVGKVLKQGEHAVRGTASQIAIMVEVDDELRRALVHAHGLRIGVRPRREVVAKWLGDVLARGLDGLRADYRRSQNDEVTHPGVAPPSISCHPGNRCTNWPQCEHCGPARL